MKMNRLTPHDPDNCPWKTINVSTALSAVTYDVNFNLTPVLSEERLKAEETKQSGVAIPDLFSKHLSFFDNTSARMEFTKIYFSLSDNDLDCWNSKRHTPITTINSVYQESVKRHMMDNPLSLLGYEIKYDTGEIVGSSAKRNKSFFSFLMPSTSSFGIDFPYIVSGYELRRVLAANFRRAGCGKDESGIDKTKKQTVITISNAAGLQVGDKIRVDGDTATISAISGNALTLATPGINYPKGRDAIVRQVVQSTVVQNTDPSEPTDTVRVDDVRGFFVGMPVKVGRGKDDESAIIVNVHADRGELASQDEQQPGTIQLDIYLQNPHRKNRTVIHDSLSANELIGTYFLTVKSVWHRDHLTRDNVQRVLKKAVKADSSVNGLSFFVGENGLEVANISSDITFRPAKKLLPYQPPSDIDKYGNPTQCLCIGCDQSALQAQMEQIETDMSAATSFVHI
jgi:hypothetical protein